MAVSELATLEGVKLLLQLDRDATQDPILSKLILAANEYIRVRVRQELVEGEPAPTPPQSLVLAAEYKAADLYSRYNAANTDAVDIGYGDNTRPIVGQSFTIRDLIAPYRRARLA